LDFEALFAAMPTAYLVLTPDLVIVEANAAYLSLVGHRREDLVGRPVFEVFPPDTDALHDGARNPLEESFKRARDTGRPDLLPLTKYDVQDPVSGRVLERYWSLVSVPVLDEDGSTRLLMQRVEDVTTYVTEHADVDDRPQWESRVHLADAELYTRMRQLEAAQEGEMAAVAALQASEQRARAVLDTAVDAILTVDDTGRVHTVNRAAELMFGTATERIVGCDVGELIADVPRDRRDGFPGHDHVTGEAWDDGRSREASGRRPDGSMFPVELAVSPVGRASAGEQMFTVVVRDITDRKRLEAQLVEQALHDPLTGLPNRRLLVERLDLAVARRARHAGRLALLFVDLDRFKLVNDTLGHEAGDELLTRTAARLREVVRPEDLVARLGGDEFVILCEGLPDALDAEAVARRVVRTLSSPVHLRGREIYVSASVGVVTDDGQRTASELLGDADAAMYQAKDEGRGRYSLVDDSTRAASSDRLQLTSELHHALERAELRSRYQPMVDLGSGEVVAAEALLRWQHPGQGLLPPGAFLDLADDVGLIGDFDAWMLGTACPDTAKWGRLAGVGRRRIGVWVNLSARSLADPRLPTVVAHAVTRSGIDPGLLTLEITEGVLMRNAPATARTLAALRDLGVQLAVDDFGTGYSSLAYLQQFPVHALKVDRSFVGRLDQAPGEAEASRTIIQAIVSLAAGLGLRTVAEGIETPEQLAAVTELGCDLGQGFFLGRPTTTGNITLAARSGVVLPSAYSLSVDLSLDV
jgi:diguanylate cyclase (GGDEF)-like protein/PAS domain S-box-containing protein